MFIILKRASRISWDSLQNPIFSPVVQFTAINLTQGTHKAFKYVFGAQIKPAQKINCSATFVTEFLVSISYVYV